mmetsp:Transcript_2190/g.3449  ORF Transcript_2190/g.3449 Transcript_2190/m.3449 type:complete len:330 (+) Transcript_2190:94-1083(+)
MRKSLGSLNPLRLLSWRRRGKTPSEEVDMAVLDGFTIKTLVLQSIPPVDNHPINAISSESRGILWKSFAKCNSTTDALESLDSYLNDRFVKQYHRRFSSPELAAMVPFDAPNSAETRQEIDTGFRLYLTKQYFRRLRRCIDRNEIDIGVLTPSVSVRLLDCILRGTAAERLAWHMQLFGLELNEEGLQECLYALYEPEVETCQALFLEMDSSRQLHKHHAKRLPKFAKTYLLDNAELNVKIRCSLAWSDPDYSGFQALPDDFKQNSTEYIKSQREHFPELPQIGQTFMRDYIRSRAEYYAERAELRTTLWRGFGFFIVTCLADWAVCVL